MSSWKRILRALANEVPTSVLTYSDPTPTDTTSLQKLQQWFDDFIDDAGELLGTKSSPYAATTNSLLSSAAVSVRRTLAPGNRSMVNAANFASGLGVLVNHWGSVNIDNVMGIVGIGIGRTTDIFDGKLARSLDQESEIGKILDHSLDKVAMADIIYHAWKKDVGPKPALAAIAILNSANALITVATKVLTPGKELAPTRSGKLSIALQALTIGAFMFERQTEAYEQTSRVFRLVGRLTTGASLALGAHSTLQYARRLGT